MREWFEIFFTRSIHSFFYAWTIDTIISCRLSCFYILCIFICVKRIKKVMVTSDFSTIFPLLTTTLHSRIKAWSGINAQGGRSPNFNKRTVLNKHTGWKNTKFLINTQDGISTQCNFCQYIQN